MIRYFLLPLILVSYIFAANLHFKLYKKDGEIPGNRLLVIGGIHGNEPGGYFAPSMLILHYKIKKGSLWIVPNLNFDSDIRNRRGVYGDMNRKFAKIDKNDSDYKIVKDIKKIILNPKVDLVLNLHDGHGFYRHYWENTIFNPKAWGQTCIIDQKHIDSKKFGDLDKIAKKVANTINKKLIKNRHTFNIKNTKTKFKDEQMRLSLTYFAITHNKPAFAIETSKNIKDLSQKVYYQLNAIETFMKVMGIEYKRDFELNISTIKKLLKDFGIATINCNIKIDLNHIKNHLSYFPLNKNSNTIKGSHPLLAFLKKENRWNIMIGNKKITTLSPDFVSSKKCINDIEMEIDGIRRKIKVPSYVHIENSFLVKGEKGYRINVIGFSKPGINNESDILIKKDNILKRFSLDKNSKQYKVEIYKKDDFCGMVVIDFK